MCFQFPGGNFPNATQGLEVLTAMLGDVFFNSIGSWTGSMHKISLFLRIMHTNVFPIL